MVLHCVLLQMSVQNIFLVRKKILKRDIDIVWRQMRSFYKQKFIIQNLEIGYIITMNDTVMQD